MMVANSSNLIITVKPVNQRMTLAPQRGAMGRHSNMSSNSHASSHQSQASNASYHSAKSFDSEPVAEDDEDEVEDHLSHSQDTDGRQQPNLVTDSRHSNSDQGLSKHEHNENSNPSSNNNSKNKIKVEKNKVSEAQKENDDPIVTL